jgi:small subunit ribosomal protein S20
VSGFANNSCTPTAYGSAVKRGRDLRNPKREVETLANIKSAKKRILVIETKTLRNKMIKSELKTLIKKVNAAVAAGDKNLANESLKTAVKALDQAAAKGTLHKNTAAHKVSQLTKAVNAMA